MKSAKAPPLDGPSSRRSQPVRQTRANPPRSSGRMPASGARDAHGAGQAGDQPIDIFPAITHFADVMTALPKELVRHFTLLKEVDAKIFAPEEQLFKLVDTVASPFETDKRRNEDKLSSNVPSSAPMSVQGSTGGGPAASAPSVDDILKPTSAAFDLTVIPRRQLFRQTAFKLQEMLVSLEEKNHVISTANEALSRQLARVEDVWPFLEGEFSDEAKWGSTTHWAYPENRTGKSSTERARRDGAAAISAAAQALVDEAAARSDARKQAVQAKKNLKNNHNDDADDHDGRPKAEVAKKSHSGKSRKTAEAGSVGLGISSAAHTNPTTKKRKVEKPAVIPPPVVGGVPMERTLSGVFGSSSSKAKTTSPRATPAPEPKKRKALPNASTQANKKSRNGPGASPSVASSPVVTSIPEPKVAARASPNPGVVSRPASSRARQNSLQSSANAAADGPKSRPASSAANKPNRKPSEPPEPAPAISTGNRPNEPKINKEESLPPKQEPKKDAEPKEPPPPPPPLELKKEATSEARERRKSLSIPLSTHGMPLVTTKSGRASKPSTPAIATFQEAARSRASRNADNGGNTSGSGSGGGNGGGTSHSNHSHSNSASAKETSGAHANGNGNGVGAGTATGTGNDNGNGAGVSHGSNHGSVSSTSNRDAAAAAPAAVANSLGSTNPGGNSHGASNMVKKHQKRGSTVSLALAARIVEEEAAHSGPNDEEEGDIDADEPRYCYCNGVSYGEMVACDSNDCTREWFHLACVGLKVAPGRNAKWYCEDCKERLKMAGKKANGR